MGLSPETYMLDLRAPGHTALGCRPVGGSTPAWTSEAAQAAGAGPERLGAFYLFSDPSLQLKPALLFQVSSRW